MKKHWSILLGFCIALILGASSINICSDLVGFLVDEGFTLYGARRVLHGEIPYKDFFFLWSPGVLYWHAAIQSYITDSLFAGRLAQLPFCAFLVAASIKITKDRFLLPTSFALLAGFYSLLWGFTLWNMPYASWYAIAFSMAAYLAIDKNIFIAGMFFALSFWMKQNVGILSCCGAIFFFLLSKNKKNILLLIGGFSLLFIPGVFFFYTKAALQEFTAQVFLFPLVYKTTMFKGLALSDISFSRFFFYLLSFLVWPCAAFFFRREKNIKLRRELLLYWLCAFGAFLQVYPRIDFQHVLFSFSLGMPLYMYILQNVWKKPNSIVSKLFFTFPAVLLFIGGIQENAKLFYEKIMPEEKIFGLATRGEKALVLKEAEVMMRELQLQLPKGAPLLFYPHMETLYYLGEFNNPTPHNQFLPGYIEFFGDAQVEILPMFEERGGSILVYTRNSGLEPATAAFFSMMQKEYFEYKRYPKLFSLYKKKSMIKNNL